MENRGEAYVEVSSVKALDVSRTRGSMPRPAMMLVAQASCRLPLLMECTSNDLQAYIIVSCFHRISSCHEESKLSRLIVSIRPSDWGKTHKYSCVVFSSLLSTWGALHGSSTLVTDRTVVQAFTCAHLIAASQSAKGQHYIFLQM
jgi:hypothetical protein